MIEKLKKVKKNIGTGLWKVWVGGKYLEFSAGDKDASLKFEEIMKRCQKTLKR